MNDSLVDSRDCEHEHRFVEEREPSGRLILCPCLLCGLSAMDAMDALRTERDLLAEEGAAAPLAAYIDRIQSLLCSFSLNDRERMNAIASTAHQALLRFGGGYGDPARAERERAWKQIAHG